MSDTGMDSAVTDFSTAFKALEDDRDDAVVETETETETEVDAEAAVETAVEAESDVEAATETKPADIWDGATEAQRAAFAGVQEQLRRRLVENERLKARPEAKKADVSEKVQRYKADYPELADPTEEMVAPAIAAVEDVKARLEEIERRDFSNYIAAQEAALVSAHPDFPQIKESPAFTQWLLAQPDEVRQIAINNSPEIINAHSAGYLLSLYKRDNAPKPSLTPQRKKQLEASVTAPDRGPSATPASANDFSSAFKAKEREYARLNS